jgi:hypothetical protein
MGNHAGKAGRKGCKMQGWRPFVCSKASQPLGCD